MNYRIDDKGKWLIQDDGGEVLVEPSLEFLANLEPTKEEKIANINSQVIAKIREVYSQDDEFKMINLGITDSTNVDYVVYRSHVDYWVNWSNVEISKLG